MLAELQGDVLLLGHLSHDWRYIFGSSAFVERLSRTFRAFARFDVLEVVGAALLKSVVVHHRRASSNCMALCRLCAMDLSLKSKGLSCYIEARQATAAAAAGVVVVVVVAVVVVVVLVVLVVVVVVVAVAAAVAVAVGVAVAVAGVVVVVAVVVVVVVVVVVAAAVVVVAAVFIHFW